jgi:osmotically-inducible protein OsmY
MSQTISRTTDAQIHKNVLDELTFEPSIDASNIGVAVNEGVVTLTGSVTNFSEKWAAEHVIKRVHGVKGVAEEITVNLFPGQALTDSDIALAARRALEWDSNVPEERVQIQVEAGWVTLEGELDWHFQRQAAHDAVARLRGVKRISNQIVLKPRASQGDIRAQIESTFKRSAVLDASHVRIEVDGGNITLHGRLPTWAERDAATRAAWNAPGVASVSNRIIVGV